MPNSVLKEALGLGRSVIEGVRIEGGSTIISARPRRRAPRETLIYSRRNAPQGPPGQAREGVLWYNIRR